MSSWRDRMKGALPRFAVVAHDLAMVWLVWQALHRLRFSVAVPATLPLWSAEIALVMAAQGYPESPKTGDPIEGLAEVSSAEGVTVFHAGTASKDGKVVTSGGRVLGVTAMGTDLVDARRRAYAVCDKIRFPGAHFRRDIGAKGLRAPVA